MATKYLLTYHGGTMPTTEEEGKRIMAAWMTWFERLGKSVVDPGVPVAKAKTIASDGSVSDGGGTNPVTGYSLIFANSLDAVVELVRDCPILGLGGSVEISETYATM